MAHSPETGPPLSGEQNDVASLAQAEGSAPLVSWWELADLPESVQNKITQARALSTRRLFALKWFVFAWCSTCGTDPVSRDISLILSFLQELLDKGRSPSTLKVYVAAIAASHAPIVSQSVGRNRALQARRNPMGPDTLSPFGPGSGRFFRAQVGLGLI